MQHISDRTFLGEKSAIKKKNGFQRKKIALLHFTNPSLNSLFSNGPLMRAREHLIITGLQSSIEDVY